LIFTFNISAQVGINTDTPSQALDINGKIEIGDDAATPTEGTIRYNSTTKGFEGYNGTNWVAFDNTIEYAFKITNPSSYDINFFTVPPFTNIVFDNGNCVKEIGTSYYFVAPVSGRYQLNLTLNLSHMTELGGLLVQFDKVLNGSPSTIRRYVHSTIGRSSYETFSMSPLFDLVAGEQIRIWLGNNGSSSQVIKLISVGDSLPSIELSGFLIH
tara:strand:- start:2532 stop:3170 length:639 start_codon:yes stop_codon:yes gene_type:complete